MSRTRKTALGWYRSPKGQKYRFDKQIRNGAKPPNTYDDQWPCKESETIYIVIKRLILKRWGNDRIARHVVGKYNIGYSRAWDMVKNHREHINSSRQFWNSKLKPIQNKGWKNER